MYHSGGDGTSSQLPVLAPKRYLYETLQQFIGLVWLVLCRNRVDETGIEGTRSQSSRSTFHREFVMDNLRSVHGDRTLKKDSLSAALAPQYANNVHRFPS